MAASATWAFRLRASTTISMSSGDSGRVRLDLLQIQHNYVDIENQAGTKGLQYPGGRGWPW